MMMAFSFMDIFNYIGYIFGYLLWFFFNIVNNFGVAIILFTIVIKLILFPFSIKQQKSTVVNARLAGKQAEIRKKYANDRQKQNEELTKLMQEEGANPMGGCLTSFAPLLLMLGVYYSVVHPLQNTLHIAADKVNSAFNLLGTIPVIGDSFNSFYGEIEIIKLFPYIKGQLTMFSPEDLNNVADFNAGFNFLGLDLLSTPSTSAFSSMLWLVPVLCFLSSVATTYFMQKIQNNPMAQGQGCMKGMLYIMPLFSAWIAYTVPAAVGFYWIISTILGFAQTLVLNHFYNVHTVNAKQEAQRIETVRIIESNQTQSYDPSRFNENDYKINDNKENFKNKKKKKLNKK